MIDVCKREVISTERNATNPRHSLEDRIFLRVHKVGWLEVWGNYTCMQRTVLEIWRAAYRQIRWMATIHHRRVKMMCNHTGIKTFHGNRMERWKSAVRLSAIPPSVQHQRPATPSCHQQFQLRRRQVPYHPTEDVRTCGVYADQRTKRAGCLQQGELSTSKSRRETFQSDRKRDVTWNGTNLDHTHPPGYLAITLDRYITYRNHCMKIRAKLSSRNNLLRKVRGTNTERTHSLYRHQPANSRLHSLTSFIATYPSLSCISPQKPVLPSPKNSGRLPTAT